MVGRNPLWVAKQHGHSVQTMLEVYAAWTGGAGDAEVAAIKRAIESTSRPLGIAICANATPAGFPR
jgi:integrase